MISLGRRAQLIKYLNAEFNQAYPRQYLPATTRQPAEFVPEADRKVLQKYGRLEGHYGVTQDTIIRLKLATAADFEATRTINPDFTAVTQFYARAQSLETEAEITALIKDVVAFRTRE